MNLLDECGCYELIDICEEALLGEGHQLYLILVVNHLS